ncbi:MAG: dihydrolipoyl dehydrogenase [Pseudomonadota bacterium]
MSSYDLIVIGAGPGGYSAAIRASQLGARVMLVERDEVGGVCLNRGCIPTKAMIVSAHALTTVKRAHEFGVNLPNAASASIDMARVAKRKDEIVTKLRAGIMQLLKGSNIELVKGSAQLVGIGKVEIDGRAREANNILIATGSSWIELPNLKPDGKNIVTTDEALSWNEVPKNLMIVGGGVVGCEFACMMHSFGSQVTVIEATSSILPPAEKSISRLLARFMKEQGIQIITETTVRRAEVSGDMVNVALSNGNEMRVAKVLLSAGRKPETSGLNLETCAIELTERSAISVDDNFKTSADAIFAIGDVIAGPMLAHTASAQAISCVQGIFGDGCHYDAAVVPSPIFTSPEIGSVGATSEELKQKGIEFKSGRFPYAGSGKALCDGETDGQAIVHADEKGKILGAHIIGQDATLLIPEIALAMRKGMTARDIEETIHGHPTLSEIIGEAAADVYGHAMHKAKSR